MNLDDESHLSSYLDDELDPADRLAVEWSVESSPPLADQLRLIALARDAVAGLDRPSIPRDLAPSVGRRIAADRRRARLGAMTRPALAISGFSGIAASLIFALILLNESLHPTLEPAPNIANQDEQAASLRNHPIALSNLGPIPARPAPPLVQVDRSPSTREALPDGPSNPSAPPGEASEREHRRLIAGILERPRVRRVVIVADVLEDASERVRVLIHQDARRTPEFGRISICQDIVLDPDHAEAAEVFAVAMDERGRQSFVDRLHQVFPGLVEEGQASPGLVTQLSEVGRLAVFRGAEAAPLGEPPAELRSLIAKLGPEPPAPIVGPDRGPMDLIREGAPPAMNLVQGQKDAAPGPDFVGPPDLDRIEPLKPNEPVTLLVWVTRPARPESMSIEHRVRDLP